MTEIIKLNIGGYLYTTSKNTLCKYSNSMLGTMFSSDNFKLTTDSEGYYFIDRNGIYFDYILKFLRDDKLNIEDLQISEIKDLLDEANFYMLDGLVEYLIYHGLEKDRDQNMEIYIYEHSNINIREFETEFNELFTINNMLSLENVFWNVDRAKKPIKEIYHCSKDGFNFSVKWEPSSIYNTDVGIKFNNFIRKYNKIYVSNYSIYDNKIECENLKNILENLNNHPSNVFRTPYKHIKLYCDFSHITLSFYL